MIMTEILKKHAMLIMAHNQFEILKKLMIQLDHPRNDIYIHVDRKSKDFKQSEFENICTKSKVVFIPRMKVYWGDSSIVDCELNLMKAAIDSEEDYMYFHLLSGVDLQIKHTEQIHAFFDEHPDRQFLAFRNAVQGSRGVAHYYYFGRLREYNKPLAKGLNYVSQRIQTKLKVNRLKDIPYRLYKTQQWFSITPECAEYVLSQREFIETFTKHTSCSDEMFLGTVIMNSPYAKQVYRPRGMDGHMRLIDRVRAEKASPHTMVMEDWSLIQNCPYFWARKFDIHRDTAIIDKVFETWS